MQDGMEDVAKLAPLGRDSGVRAIVGLIRPRQRSAVFANVHS
jgi:hypothetical protein